jgi:hypothetical protein
VDLDSRSADSHGAVMKINAIDYARLKEALQTGMRSRPDVKLSDYLTAGMTERRFAWDMLHVSKFSFQGIYAYANDSHIDTALRSILKEVRS